MRVDVEIFWRAVGKLAVGAVSVVDVLEHRVRNLAVRNHTQSEWLFCLDVNARVGVGASRSQHRGLLVGVDALLLRRLHQLGQQMVVLKVLEPCINHFIKKTADET